MLFQDLLACIKKISLMTFLFSCSLTLFAAPDDDDVIDDDFIKQLVRNTKKLLYSDDELMKHEKFSELVRAIKQLRYDDVERLVKIDGMDPNDHHPLKLAPITYAIRGGDLPMVKLLVSLRANIHYDASNRLYGSPIMDAISFRKPEILQFLIDQGVDPSKVVCTEYPAGGTTPIAEAAARGYTDIVKILIQNKVRVDDEALIRASAAYVGEDILFNMYPIHEGHYEVVKLLLDNLNTDNKNKILGILLRNAVSFSTLRMLELILQYGADLQTVYEGNLREDNLTLLHILVQNIPSRDQTETIKKLDYLLQRGLQINQLDSMGRSALHLAAENGNFAAVRVLLERGALIFIDIKGRSPLHYASMNHGNAAVVQHLLQRYRNLDLRLQDMEGRTALHYAAEAGHMITIRLLIQRNPNIMNLQDADGNTALHLAALNGRLEAVQWLHQNGANAEIRNHLTRSPLDLAVIGRNRDVVNFLTPLTQNRDMLLLLEDLRLARTINVFEKETYVVENPSISNVMNGLIASLIYYFRSHLFVKTSPH